MNRIVWLGPLLSVMLFASGAFAQLLDRDPGRAAVASLVHVEKSPHVFDPSRQPEQRPVARAVNDSNTDLETVQLCGCSACSGNSYGFQHAAGSVCATRCCIKRPRRWQTFGEIEYLNWWSSGQDLPVLIAAGDGLPPSQALFGGREVGEEIQAAVRSTSGLWLDDCQTSALVLRSYRAEGSDVGTSVQSNGTPAFAVPFTNDSSNPAMAGQPDSLILADTAILQPGVPGSARAAASNIILGGDAYFSRLFRKGCGYRVDLLAGVQFSHMDDEVFLQTASSRTGPDRAFGTIDTFDAENNYYAGELGMILQCTRGPLTIQLLSKMGLGSMNQQVTISGFNSFDGSFTGGGIFAQDQAANGGPTFNTGEHERNKFAWSPEINAKTIWRLNDNVDFTMGYTFMYWSEVVLAGEHIDTRVNRDVLFDGPFIAGGGSNPSFRFRGSDYWVHSFDLGLAMRF